jgi:hypothetical protein
MANPFSLKMIRFVLINFKVRKMESKKIRKATPEEDAKHEEMLNADMEYEQSREVLGKTKRIKDAFLGTKTSNRFLKTFEQTDTINMEVGDRNAPPIEMTDKDLAEIVAKRKTQEAEQEKTRSGTMHFNNGTNEWRLIAKTYNNFMEWEHVTTAMQMGDEGCLVCVKEAIGQKMHSTMTFVPRISLELNKGKWELVSTI